MTPNERNGSGTGGGAERDPRLDRAYRAGAREEPPARLDDAILAAAHRELGARPRAVSARLWAWRVPVSIAAVVVLSVSLVTLVREEGGGKLESDSRSAMDRYSRSAETAPAPPAAAPEAAKEPASAKLPAAGPAARNDSVRDDTVSARKTEEDSRRAAEASAARSAAPERQALPRAVVPTPQPFQGAPAAREQGPALSADQAAGAGTAAPPSIGMHGMAPESAAMPAEQAAAPKASARMMQRDRAATGEVTGSVSAMAPPPATAVAPADKPSPKPEARVQRSERPLAPARVAALLKEFESQPPEKWLEKIEALKREGRKEEADEMLAEFRRRFPDHPLPPGLR